MGGRDKIPFARACSDATNQQWKLYADNTLRPKSDTSKCLFLIEPGEVRSAFLYYGFKVLPCSSRYRNKKFMFEYLTLEIESEPKLHTFFKLKVKNQNIGHANWQGKNICLEYNWTYMYRFERDDWLPDIVSCTCPSDSADLFSCMVDFASQNSFGWFKFEPVSE